MTTLSEIEAYRRDQVLKAIDGNATGKHVLTIKALLALFGFKAVSRVRQSSLAEVTRSLSDWGIGHRFPGGTSTLDYIHLLRLPAEKPTPARAPSLLPLPPETAAPQLVSLVSPLEFAFDVGEAVEPLRSASLAQDLCAAVWSAHPVLLFVDAVDEFFALSGGFFSAIMRRRERMIRSGGYGAGVPTSPTVVSVAALQEMLRPSEGFFADFPHSGAVYILRDDAEHRQDDDLVAMIREMYIPHTYRLSARFVSTAGASPRADSDPRLSGVLSWLALYAGAPALVENVKIDELTDLASLFAEATQIRETLIERATLSTTDPDFRAGFESTEHMVLKNLVAKHLRARFPQSETHIERSITASDTRRGRDGADDADFESELEGEDRSVKGRPDVRCPGNVCVEVETLRSVVLRGSNPFFALEQKLRRKLDTYNGERQLWLAVPSDVALLAAPQLQALIKNLSDGRTSPKIALTVLDTQTGEPCFLPTRGAERVDVRLVGATWREKAPDENTAHLTWDDVAGYSDMKGRLREDVLAPLLDPARFARHKLGSSNGLLLYGLPGCGKSLIGRVLAGEADLPCRRLIPSDFTANYIGQGTMKIRDQFDWAIKRAPCLLVIDELDAIAPQREHGNMHTDEMRQVNELLAQLDRMSDKSIMIVGTTNFYRGIDSAIVRSGRFDTKLPVFPPNESDRKLIFDHYLGPRRLAEIDGIDQIDTTKLARIAPLFAPADIRAVVELAARRAITRASNDQKPRLDEFNLVGAIKRHTRSIQPEGARLWVDEVANDVGEDETQVRWLREEIARAYGP